MEKLIEENKPTFEKKKKREHARCKKLTAAKIATIGWTQKEAEEINGTEEGDGGARSGCRGDAGPETSASAAASPRRTAG
jgi:hypothetical protein